MPGMPGAPNPGGRVLVVAGRLASNSKPITILSPSLSFPSSICVLTPSLRPNLRTTGRRSLSGPRTHKGTRCPRLPRLVRDDVSRLAPLPLGRPAPVAGPEDRAMPIAPEAADPPLLNASSISASETSGRNRRAALGTLSTSSTDSITILTLEVIPGLSLSCGFGTSIMAL